MNHPLIAPDPLDSLFVKEDEVNRELLREVLTPYVRLDEKGRVFPLTRFYQLSNKEKILILLLSRKAIALKTGSKESIGPTELGQATEIPDGSIRPALRMLYNEKLVDEENGKYKVFAHALQRYVNILSTEKSDSDDEQKIIISQTRKSSNRSGISMNEAIGDLVRQGALDEPKTVREIYNLILQRRPGTEYQSLYKVVLDNMATKKLVRELKEENWAYRRAINVT